jgi:hypothetical protein
MWPNSNMPAAGNTGSLITATVTDPSPIPAPFGGGGGGPVPGVPTYPHPKRPSLQ